MPTLIPAVRSEPLSAICQLFCILCCHMFSPDYTANIHLSLADILVLMRIIISNLDHGQCLYKDKHCPMINESQANFTETVVGMRSLIQVGPSGYNGQQAKDYSSMLII